jgi:hypothetical protein
MGVDRTQGAIEILKYFYENSYREYGITISELRKNILPRRRGRKVWLKSKLGLGMVKDVISIYLNLDYIAKSRPITMKNKKFDSYVITKKGMNVVKELKSSKHLHEMFNAILYAEAMRPT